MVHTNLDSLQAWITYSSAYWKLVLFFPKYQQNSWRKLAKINTEEVRISLVRWYFESIVFVRSVWNVAAHLSPRL